MGKESGKKVKEKKRRSKKFWLAKWTGILVLSLILLFLVSFGSYSLAFTNKIYKNQYVGTTNFGGKNSNQAKTAIKDLASIILDKEITLKYLEENKIYKIKPAEIGLEINADKTIEELWSAGRRENVFLSSWDQLLSLSIPNKHHLVFSYNKDSLDQKIRDIADEIDQPEKDFELVFTEGRFDLKRKRSEGKRIDQTEIKNIIKNQIANVDIKEISFSPKEYKPQILEQSANKTLERANKIIAAGNLNLVFQDQNFTADTDSIGAFVKSQTKGKELEIIFADSRIKIFVESIAKSINIEPKNAKLSIEGGKATVFQSAVIGKELDQAQTIIDIKNSLSARFGDDISNNNPTKIDLKVTLKDPEIKESNINNLGIIELIGTATTDFKGSPENRIHNLTVGANALNGALIGPDTEFSTLAYLGKIDASSGYLEELVIKEDKTVPEFGGGLCQVSSTLFRAAINAGLKITERQNHKYRVSYYEPPVGMDATIYDPAPDLKFHNNYKSHILIQSKVEKTKITFDLYGTKDNRAVSISNPEVFDIVDPGPPIMTETDKLQPGETKRIEKSHPGATARFSYKVTRGEETLQERSFTSKYVPWPEKWLVGIGTTPAPTCTDGAQNGDEVGVDCGGTCPNQCNP